MTTDSPTPPRVRFAPSPTGPLHIGALRTALFNYLFAKGQGGDFLFRIEDTDRSRYVAGATQHIEDSLDWLGIPPDEVLRSQAAQQSRYAKEALRLHQEGKAYYAFDSPEALMRMRERLAQAGAPDQHYNALTRQSMENECTLPAQEVHARLQKKEAAVLRFKSPAKHHVRFQDLIRGHIHMNEALLEDKVLLKADGLPTYHFAHVVDDHDMGITHVIRGEEWLPSTPFHLMLYEALGWEAPQFAHLPLILKPNGQGKLSKRDAITYDFPLYAIAWEASKGFKELGFLPKALCNFLARLGCTYPDADTLLDKEALAHAFKLSQVSKGGVQFDFKKACWFNAQCLRSCSPETLAKALRTNHPTICAGISPSALRQTIALMQARVTLLPELITESTFLRTAPEHAAPSPEAVQKQRPWLALCLAETDPKASPSTLKDRYIALANERELSLSNALQALRYALTAQRKGPDLTAILEIIGTEETRRRLAAFLSTSS